MKVCIVGASGKTGTCMVQHALDRGYEVVGVCRAQSVAKLDEFAGRITVVPGATDDREVIKHAVAGCDGVITVLVPRGVHGYSRHTAQAVLDFAPTGARVIFSSDPVNTTVLPATFELLFGFSASTISSSSFTSRSTMPRLWLSPK